MKTLILFLLTGLIGTLGGWVGTDACFAAMARQQRPLTPAIAEREQWIEVLGIGSRLSVRR
jgi:hypothetical protein